LLGSWKWIWLGDTSKLSHITSWFHFKATSINIHPTVTYLCVCDYRRGMDWILDLLTTCIHHSELHFTHHWHTQTSVLSLYSLH
jgi:hypothetical protein